MSNGKYCTDGDERMNTKNLNALFDRYIERFNSAKFVDFDENYKWAVCKQFRDNWDINASNFADMLNNAMGTGKRKKGLWNLTNSGWQRPFPGLLKFAKHEPETVRNMFSELYAVGDLTFRIDHFIRDSKPLVEKYGERADNQTVAAVMAYLSCWKPDEYFFYKAKEARRFATYTEFDGKIKNWPDFSSRDYFRMCNELIDAMRQREDLLRVNATRFEKERRKENRSLWPDESLHILAYDMIYCTFADQYNK